jgi:hypothetical protein
MRFHRFTAALAGACMVAGANAYAQTLDDAVDTRANANTAGVQAQKRIDELSDATDVLLTEYRGTNRQIDSLRVYNQQMRDLIISQEAELASLQGQIDTVELVGRAVAPLMLRMIDALENFIELDMPFLSKEREERLAGLRELIDRADVTDAEKYRRIMEAYQIENEYGRTIEAYRSTIANTGAERTVDFLRVGRIALVYLTLDDTEAGAWDQRAKQWVELDASYRNAISQGLRVARKQAAPELIRVPLPVPETGGNS